MEKNRKIEKSLESCPKYMQYRSKTKVVFIMKQNENKTIKQLAKTFLSEKTKENLKER